MWLPVAAARSSASCRAAGAPTVVLLHGWTATADLNWFACFAPLAEHFRVIALDHRGHGRGIRAGARSVSTDCADDVAALADVLGIERFIAVGYSMGGPIAQLLWQRHPELVAGLVLCATSSTFSGTARERLLFSVAAGRFGDGRRRSDRPSHRSPLCRPSGGWRNVRGALGGASTRSPATTGRDHRGRAESGASTRARGSARSMSRRR